MRTLLLSTLGTALLLSAPAPAVVTIDWTFVGNPGNAADDTDFGAVGYSYKIGTHEVTNAQYAEFLNAVADADTHTLYNTDMGSGFGGITRAGSSGSYSYSAIAGREDMPVNWLTFYDALRFVNWLQNGQPTGVQDDTTTEDGAYTFGGPTTVGARNPGATIALASEDEWYKAAYYDPSTSSYFEYPAGSDTQTTCAAPSATPNTANCGNAEGDVTIKGGYTVAPSPYGTFDQGGNLWEWNEAIVMSPALNRGIRGGAFSHDPSMLAGSFRNWVAPATEHETRGFRVVSAPAPAAVSIDWVTIANPGNGADGTGFGAVGYAYNIGTYEVTNAQYMEYLNAVASNDIHGLYHPNMGSGSGGITQSCAPGPNAPCTYGVISGRGDRPVSFVHFYDVLRFANWLHNGQPTGAQDSTTTEDGAYTFSSHESVGARNAGATVFLPSEDEWYKAAYYSPGGIYFDYPAGSDTPMTCAAPTATANRANCMFTVGDVTDIGSYTGSASPSGTFDQGGNVWEWNEAIIGSARGMRGGSFSFGTVELSGATRHSGAPTVELEGTGFRVAPEPGRDFLLLAGALSVLGLAGWRRARG